MVTSEQLRARCLIAPNSEFHVNRATRNLVVSNVDLHAALHVRAAVRRIDQESPNEWLLAENFLVVAVAASDLKHLVQIEALQEVERLTATVKHEFFDRFSCGLIDDEHACATVATTTIMKLGENIRLEHFRNLWLGGSTNVQSLQSRICERRE